MKQYTATVLFQYEAELGSLHYGMQIVTCSGG